MCRRLSIVRSFGQADIMTKIFFSLIVVLSIEYYRVCFGEENHVNRRREEKSGMDSLSDLPFAVSFKMSTENIALVTGYTGESGKALVKELIRNNQFQKIILLGRREIDLGNEYRNKTVVIGMIKLFSFSTIVFFRNNVKLISINSMIMSKHFEEQMFISVVWARHVRKPEQ